MKKTCCTHYGLSCSQGRNCPDYVPITFSDIMLASVIGIGFAMLLVAWWCQ